MISVLLAIQEHAAAEGFSSPFEVNFGLFFWTWVVFIGLFFALRKWAWPEILKATEERERRIKGQLEEAARMNVEAKAALDEHKKLLAGARGEAQAMLNEAKSASQKEREHLLHKTREEQEQMLERAKREIQAERERAVQELRREAVDLSLAAAAKLLERRLDDAGDRKIVSDYLGSLGNKH